MRYHDSINQANAKLTKATHLLERWRLPANPINFTVVYEFLTGKNSELIKAIDHQLSEKHTVDSFFFEEIYQLHILGQSKFRDNIVNEISDLVDDVQQNCSDSESSVSTFIEELDNNIGNIIGSSSEQLTIIASQIKRASLQVKSTQLELVAQLEKSQNATLLIQTELAEVKKEIYLDPLTGLYNRKAMNKHLDMWYAESDERKLSAIVITIDYFQEFTDKFGHLIGDVILSKVAAKIGSYVDDSGLPIRSASDEFIILLPDVDTSIASEIGDKIRQGVEKLRFISAKSKVRLPQMTLSLGIGEINHKSAIAELFIQTKQALIKAQQNGANQLSVYPS